MKDKDEKEKKEKLDEPEERTTEGESFKDDENPAPEPPPIK